MPYVSARYMPVSPIEIPGQLARPVQAIDHEGTVWSLREDSQVGDWLDFLASGGLIAAMEEPVGENLPAETNPTLLGLELEPPEPGTDAG